MVNFRLNLFRRFQRTGIISVHFYIFFMTSFAVSVKYNSVLLDLRFIYIQGCSEKNQAQTTSDLEALKWTFSECGGKIKAKL